MSSRLGFQILGPLEVRVDGAAVPVGGPKQRALLALLLLSANRVVSRERLIGELFAEQGVNSADHALRNHVSRLRKVLAPAAADEPRLVARAPGYLLRVEPGELDLDHFERLVGEGREALRAGDPSAAADSFRAAEALWEGRPLADLELEPFGRIDLERLEELRLAAVEERVDAELALGRQLALVPELEMLCVENPYRERFRAQLMLALYRSGRQAEGLEVYRRTRERLSDELGLEPGVEVQQLERAILVQDPALNGALGGKRTLPPLSGICPFKGLAHFEAADAEFFFGRERLVDELVARLAHAPLLAIVGASGSGKSSLLRAGLLPALARESLVIRPGERTPAELLDALASVPAGRRLVLAVDQFEELFTGSVAEDERRAFVDLLVDAAWDPERRVLVLVTLRADFFGQLAPYVALADLVSENHVLLGPMSGSELRRAIEEPANRTGLEVEPALVDTLVDEVAGEPGGLPLMQTALLDLWRDRDGGSLKLAAYQRIGGVRSAVGRHAEAAFRTFDEEQQEVARRIMLRLVSGGDGETFVRRRATRTELDADTDETVSRVLAALVERRLLVADDGTVELVHEALLERWPRFREWLEEDAEGRNLHRRLTAAAAEWDGGGRDTGELYRGARLSAALDWAAEHGNDLNLLEREYLDHSRAASEREEARQRRANRRLRVLLGGVAAALVLAVVAGVIAFEQRSQARREANAAEAQRLGEQALIEPTLDRSLLLAREAVNLDDSPATRSSLLAALLRSPAALAVVRTGDERMLSEALSPDGRRLAVLSADALVDTFDTRTWKRIGRFTTSSQGSLCGALGKPLHVLAFGAGDALAVGGTDGTNDTLALLTKTGTESGSTIAGKFLTADVVFGPGGRTLVTGEVSCNENPPSEVVVLRDPVSGRERRSSAPIRSGRLVGYADGGRRILVTAGDTKSLLLDARTLHSTRMLPVGGAAAVSPMRDQAAFGHNDGSVTLVDLASAKERTLDGRASGAIEALSYSADGELLTTAADNGTVAVWRTSTGIDETYGGHAAAVRAALFSPNGRSIYSAGDDGRVIAWDASGERRLGRPFRFAPGNVSTWSAVSPRGSLFALSPGFDRVAVWAAPGATPLRNELRGQVGDVSMLRFSPDGKLLAAAGNGHTVLWDMATGQIVRSIPTPGGAAGLAFSPDGRTLAIGRLDGTDSLVDLRTGTQTALLDAGAGAVQDVDFSPDGKLLAAASLNGTVTIWNVARETKVFTLGHEVAGGQIADFAVRFSPDGKLVAAGDTSGTAVLWNVQTGKPFGQPLRGHNGDVRSVDFDPSGHTLLTMSDDGKLRLWGVATQKLIGAPLPGSTTGGSAEFFPDGKHILGVSDSGAGVVWNIDPAAWKTYACRIANRNLTPAEWEQFLPGHGYELVCPSSRR